MKRSGNYTFNTTAATAADITARVLAVSATGQNRVYDGTTNASVTLGDNRVALMRGRVRLCPYFFIDDQGRTSLAGALATLAPADKKKIHGMRDAVLLPCVVE